MNLREALRGASVRPEAERTARRGVLLEELRALPAEEALAALLELVESPEVFAAESLRFLDLVSADEELVGRIEALPVPEAPLPAPRVEEAFPDGMILKE